MAFMVLAVLLCLFGFSVAAGAAFTAHLLRQRRDASTRFGYDRRSAEQAERIEALEDELRRLREQADFTERLLSERSTKKADGSG